MNHDFDMTSLLCTKCGITLWYSVNKPCVQPTMQSCCGGGNNVRWNANTAQWECKDCGAVKSNDPNYLYSGRTQKPEEPVWHKSPYKKVECECGSSKVGSDRHSDYCPLYQK